MDSDSRAAGFLALEDLSAAPRFAVLPFGYEGTVCYGGGTAGGPDAIIAASAQVELYDERLGCEPCAAGIVTLPQPEIPAEPEAAAECARAAVAGILARGLVPAVLGGEHSLSYGVYLALAEKYPGLGVVQLDAHADLREEYGGTRFSHACVMARIRERTAAVLQLGIRSLSAPEAAAIRERGYAVGFMRELRRGGFDLDAALARLPENIFLTFDLDALDLSLIRSTGTPEPGGFTWDEINDLLEKIAGRKRIVGFDLVELCPGDAASAFTAARLAYRLIGLCRG